MNSFFKEYGGFVLASISVIFAMLLITFAKANYKDMATNFIANLTGVESSEFR